MSRELNTKESKIDTNALNIQGNILSWDDTTLQLSNISSISTAILKKLSFPMWTIVCFLIGMVIGEASGMVAGTLIIVGLVGICFWFAENKDRSRMICLSIIMNSGERFCILFRDRNFLNVVLRVLKKVIINGGVGSQNISINISNCKISGNANVLDNFHAK